MHIKWNEKKMIWHGNAGEKKTSTLYLCDQAQQAQHAMFNSFSVTDQTSLTPMHINQPLPILKKKGMRARVIRKLKEVNLAFILWKKKSLTVSKYL